MYNNIDTRQHTQIYKYKKKHEYTKILKYYNSWAGALGTLVPFPRAVPGTRVAAMGSMAAAVSACSSVGAGASTGVTATVPTSAPGSSITARASVVIEGVARPVGIQSPFLMAAAAGVAGRPPTDLRDAFMDPGRPSVH